jgi:hypothetical protein
MILVLVIGLAAGSAVQIVRTRRTPFVPHGGGGGGGVWVTSDGGVEINVYRTFWGADETASPTRWTVFINRLPAGQKDQAFLDTMEARWNRMLNKANVDPASTVFEGAYGTPSKPDADQAAVPHPLPPGLPVFRATLRKTLPLKLTRGVYYISVVAKDGLQIRDKTGKIVDRGKFGGCSSTSRIVVD